MISFLLRKLWKNKWMMFALQMGNILLIGIVSAAPLYAGATVQRILQQDLRRYQMETNTIPAALKLQYVFNAVSEEHRYGVYRDTRDNLWPKAADSFGLPAVLDIRWYSMNHWQFLPYTAREERPRIRRLHFVAPEHIDEYIEIVRGRFPGNGFADNTVEVITTEAASERHNILMGELLEVLNAEDPNGPLFARVVGFYEPAEGHEVFWSAVPFDPLNTVIGSDEWVRNRLISQYKVEYNIRSEWIRVLDATAIRVRNAAYYLQTSDDVAEQFNNTGFVWNFNENFTERINRHHERVDRLPLLLWVLQVPSFVLLALFIFMVSRRILQLDQNDVAVIKSRGASRGQIMSIYVMQSLLMGAVSLPAGLLLGMFLCRLLGASNGFLDFAARGALQVEITPAVILYALLAAGFSVLTMVIPAAGYTRTGIVDYKRRTSGEQKKPLWRRYYMDILCLGAACYGLYMFNAVEISAADPLLFVGSSLFMIGLGLFCLRCYPYVIKLVFALGRRYWSPSVYASLLKIIRSDGEEQFVMLFLILTLAVGVFGAQAARTINQNNDHQIKHHAGADLMFQEYWQHSVIMEPTETGNVLTALFTEPDFNRFIHFLEVDALTPVTLTPATVRTRESTVNNVQLMGIETYTFGAAAWFREDLLRVHENFFLNTLAALPHGVLLSDNFRTRLGYQLSDTITLRNHFGADTRAVVVGFVEYWPGFAPTRREILPTGEWSIQEQYLAVANIGYLQQTWGVMPYQIWMRTNSASNAFFRRFLDENPLRLEAFYDTRASLAQSRTDPVLQGINGVLTVGFIATLLICCTGFLLYWVLTIRSRTLQFGIFRAMGMTMRGIIRLLVSEQLLITVTAIIIGAAVGEISARLFIPYIQVSFLTEEQLIPLLVVRDKLDYLPLYATVGGMIVICLLILSVFVSRLKIDQALKLGED
jgi:putative ABC transport system permease protein